MITETQVSGFKNDFKLSPHMANLVQSNMNINSKDGRGEADRNNGIMVMIAVSLKSAILDEDWTIIWGQKKIHLNCSKKIDFFVDICKLGLK